MLVSVGRVGKLSSNNSNPEVSINLNTVDVRVRFCCLILGSVMTGVDAHSLKKYFFVPLQKDDSLVLDL